MRENCFAVAIGVLAALPAAHASAPWFEVTFDRYEIGERLSDKGATAGSWGDIPAGVVATNVLVGSEKKILFRSEDGSDGLVFTADESAQKPAWSVDLGFRFDDPILFGDEEWSEPVGFALTDDGANGYSFAGIVNGKWYRLGSEAVVPQPKTWYSLRFETAVMGGDTYISFAVVNDSATNVLTTAEGMRWFPTDGWKIETMKSVVIQGSGGLGAFTALRDVSGAKPSLYWIGGSSGDWTDPTNWALSSDGAAAERIPAPGEFARIAGTVQLTLNGETGSVRDVLAYVGADGKITFEGGDVLAESKETVLDVSQPRIGKPLTVVTTPFNGTVPSVTVKWYRSKDVSRTNWTLAGTGRSFTPSTVDCEHWLRCVATNANGDELLTREIFFSKLPVFYLTTDDGQAPSPSKEPHDGKLYVQGNAQWKSQYDGKMTLSVRGNTTATQPKKPWKLKLKDKSKMLDFAKSKSWVLLANYLDESNLRNKLAYDFANEIGSLGMQSTWVECVLNGEWQGLYLFGEQIKIDKNRVNVYDWESAAEDTADALAEKLGLDDDATSALEDQMNEHLDWITTGKVTVGGTTYALGNYVKGFASVTNDLTGGYLFEFDWGYDEVSKFKVYAGTERFELDTMFKSPEFANTCPAMFDWCKGFIQEYADAITSVDGYSPQGRHYSELCDVESLVSYFLVMEMFGNDDGRYKSIYSHKDRGGAKMKYGPVWDFDWGVGNFQVPYNPEQWLVLHSVWSMYREWVDDPWFCTLLWTRYPAARAKFEEIIRDGGLIDEYYALLKEAGEANERRWVVNHSGYIRRSDPTYGFRGGIYGTTRHPGLKKYLTDRIAWMDRQFADVPTLMASLKIGIKHSFNDSQVPLGPGGIRGDTAIDSSWPYVREVAKLPLTVLDAESDKFVYRGQSPRLAFTVGDTDTSKVGVYVNGIKVGEPVPLGADRKLAVKIPLAAFTAAKDEPNCISLVGWNDGGKMTARNYCLLTIDRRGALMLVVQ